MQQEEKNQFKEFPQVKVKLSKSGELNFEGELNSESQKLLEQCLQQAEYYRHKSSETETRHHVRISCTNLIWNRLLALLPSQKCSSYFCKTPKGLDFKHQVDSVVIVFFACLLALVSFGSYIVVSHVTNWFREVTTDVRR